LDFVAPGLDFVAFGFDFIAVGLDFIAAGLVFVRNRRRSRSRDMRSPSAAA
jgi:hypothetical protein